MSSTYIWWAGLLTLAAATAFPRLNDYLSGDGGRLDSHDALFLGIVAVATIVIFGLVGRWAVQSPSSSSRPARVGLVCSLLGVVGVLAFYVSAPIILGGLGMTLGYEAYRRAADAGHRRMALADMIIGAVAALIGMLIWLLG